MNVRPDVKTCLRIHATRVLPHIVKLVRVTNRVIVGGLCSVSRVMAVRSAAWLAATFAC